MRFKAAILVEQRKPLVVDLVQLKNKLKVGQVLVKIHFTGICGSQIGEINGVKGPDKYLPHLLGHEASGQVVDIGPGVKSVDVDDYVVMHWKKGEGINSEPPNYSWNKKKLNAGQIATFNEYAVISENRLTLLPKKLKLNEAALYGCAVTTGFGLIENKSNLKIGESVVVYGSGGVGLNIIQAAKITGAHPIIAIDRTDEKLKLAKTMGASHSIRSDSSDIFKKISKIIGEKNIDIFIDNTGVPDIISRGYENLNTNGRVLLVGVPKADNNINIYSLPLHFGKIITGTHGGDGNPNVDIPRYSKYLSAMKNPLSKIISKTYSLDKINTAIELMTNGKIEGRCVIKL